jgi:hypothetical protein
VCWRGYYCCVGGDQNVLGKGECGLALVRIWGVRMDSRLETDQVMINDDERLQFVRLALESCSVLLCRAIVLLDVLLHSACSRPIHVDSSLC